MNITDKEQSLVIERFKDLKQERTRYMPRWREIRDYVSITNEVNSEFEDTKQPSEQKDIFINDPTAFISVNQAGDYLAGILWNLNAVTLEPSKYIKDKAQGSDLSKFYKKATEVFLEQMNATDAGFHSVLKSYCYEQFSFGTSGIGTFKSKEFENKQSECCLTFKPFGVWNTAIDEGANNKIDVVYTVYHWRLNQIIEEFCYTNGQLNKELVEQLPDEIKEAYEANKFNQKFKLVFGILPNSSYTMETRGKNGAKYKGYWFLDNSSNKIFKVDYFDKMPISMCRQIRVNNQVYGESAGTLAISSVKMLNHIAGNTVDNIEKTTDAPLGIISGSLVAGNVLNRSANSVTVFNPQSANTSNQPIFPISQAGDISAVVNFLIPQLQKTIINMFKIDQLLDFNNQTEMTATESSYRMSIRGKAINGLLSQQKTECIEPTCHRAISIIQNCNLFGFTQEEIQAMPEETEEQLAYKQQLIATGDYIPEVVVNAMKDNKMWYSLKFNGELEKLCNAEIYEAIGRFLQYLSAILNLKPEVAHAINGYEFLDLLKSVSNLVNDKLIKNKHDYDNIIKKIEDAQAKQAEIQNMIAQSQMAKNMASAGKDGAIANGTA
ncbi:hypothetical protein IJD34_01025 [bacterium]|nr:hypothetical protein [bacterium]